MGREKLALPPIFIRFSQNGSHRVRIHTPARYRVHTLRLNPKISTQDSKAIFRRFPFARFHRVRALCRSFADLLSSSQSFYRI